MLFTLLLCFYCILVTLVHPTLVKMLLQAVACFCVIFLFFFFSPSEQTVTIQLHNTSAQQYCNTATQQHIAIFTLCTRPFIFIWYAFLLLVSRLAPACLSSLFTVLSFFFFLPVKSTNNSPWVHYALVTWKKGHNMTLIHFSLSFFSHSLFALLDSFFSLLFPLYWSVKCTRTFCTKMQFEKK